MRPHHPAFFCLLLLVWATPLVAQVYFPLAVGNRWDYGSWEYPPGGFVYQYSAVITGDTLMPNGRLYARYHVLNTDSYLRQEGSRVYAWADSVEVLKYDFGVVNGDTVSYRIAGADTFLTTVSVSNAMVLGRQLQSWTYASSRVNDPGLYESGWWTISDSIGYSGSFQSPGNREYLLGAVIDGKVYGTVTAIEGKPSAALATFALEQNWPNPFNPVTTIGYTVGGIGDQGSGNRNVKLTVYNLLGQEVAVLVNERKAPGMYTVRFDGNHLASGLYLYRLQAGSRVETKKMLLLR